MDDNFTPNVPKFHCVCREEMEKLEMLEDLMNQPLKRPAEILLPSFGVDFHQRLENFEDYLEAFQLGMRVVIKDIGRTMPSEVETSLELINEAEKRFNAVRNAKFCPSESEEVDQKANPEEENSVNSEKGDESEISDLEELISNDTPYECESPSMQSFHKEPRIQGKLKELSVEGRLNEPSIQGTLKDYEEMSSGSGWSQMFSQKIPPKRENFQFEEKICRVFRFHDQNVRLGRFRRNCPVTLSDGQLVTLTMDDRYRFCSMKQIIFVENLKYLSNVREGSFIEIEAEDSKIVKIKVLKIIGMHLTCCVHIGGTLKSYSLVLETLHMDCITSIVERNIDFAIEKGVEAIILPTKCPNYGINVQSCLDARGGSCILLFAEIESSFDEQICSLEDFLEPFDGVYFRQSPDFLTEKIFLLALQTNKLVIWTHLEDICFTDERMLLIPDCFILVKHKRRLQIPPKLNHLQETIRRAHNRTYHRILSKPVCHISITESGRGAVKMAEFNRHSPVIAVTKNEEVARTLPLFKGVKGILFNWAQECESTNDEVISKFLLRLVVSFLQYSEILMGNFCIKRFYLDEKPRWKNEASDGSLTTYLSPSLSSSVSSSDC